MWIDEFYEVIMQKLMTEVVDEKDVPILKHFDLFFNQYNVEASESDKDGIDAYPKPAGFFEHDPFDYVNLGMHKKAVDDFMFTIHLESEVIPEVDYRTKPKIRQKAHDHLKLSAQVEKVLQGFNGSQVIDGFTGFGSIIIVSGKSYDARGMNMIHLLKCKTRITCDTATVTLQKLKPPTGPTPVIDDITIQIL